MTDLRTLESLAKAEAEAKGRIDAAEKEALRIISEAKREADAIKAKAVIDAAKFREQRLGEIRKEAGTLEKKNAETMRAKLDSTHPVPNTKIPEASKELLPKYVKWVEERGA